jgi:small conductance mechanosensitive channel
MNTWINSLTLTFLYLFLGIVAARVLPPIVGSMVTSAADSRTSAGLTPRRNDTLRGLAKHLTRAIIVTVTIIFILSNFVNSAGLFTFLGLFSAAFGLGARPLVQDYISGVIFIFEDQYNVGEKVEIFGIEGTVIDVTLRTTILRAPSGELFIIPNGEVRVVRNFGRGEFSLASIRVTIPSEELEHSMALLESLAPTLPARVPELIEPPNILSESGALSERVELIVFAKARFSQGVEARRKLLRIVQEALRKANVDTKTTTTGA